MNIENGGEQPANDTAVTDAPLPQDVSTEIETEADEQPEAEIEDEGGEDAPQPEPVEETEEVEFEGQKFKVPKAVKQGLMRQADYTRKTTEVAQLRQALETRLETAGTVHKEFIDALANVRAYDNALQQYEGVNWAQAELNDPTAAAQHFRRFTMLKDARANAEKTASEKQQSLAMESNRARDTRLQEVEGKLKEIMPEWSREGDFDLKLTKYGTAENLSQQDISEAILRNPHWAKVLNKARQFDETQTKAATAQRTQQQQAVRPAPQVRSGATNSTKDPNKMTDAQFFEWRKKQLAG